MVSSSLCEFPGRLHPKQRDLFVLSWNLRRFFTLNTLLACFSNGVWEHKAENWFVTSLLVFLCFFLHCPLWHMILFPGYDCQQCGRCPATDLAKWCKMYFWQIGLFCCCFRSCLFFFLFCSYTHAHTAYHFKLRWAWLKGGSTFTKQLVQEIRHLSFTFICGPKLGGLDQLCLRCDLWEKVSSNFGQTREDVTRGSENFVFLGCSRVTWPVTPFYTDSNVDVCMKKELALPSCAQHAVEVCSLKDSKA